MMMLFKTEHPKQILVRLTLWFLSTWIGTLVLCGRASLSNHFPYVQKFSKVLPKKREEILVSWSLSYFLLLRMFFRALKLVVPLAFFTHVSSFSWLLVFVMHIHNIPYNFMLSLFLTILKKFLINGS